jgi:hypothetical protein
VYQALNQTKTLKSPRLVSLLFKKRLNKQLSNK